MSRSKSSTLPVSTGTREAVAAARQVRDRVRRDHDPMLRRQRQRARKHRMLARLRRFLMLSAIGVGGLVLFSLIWSLIVDPVGIIGLFLILLLIPVVLLGAGLLSGGRRVAPASIGSAPSLPAIAARADEYLHQQRRALPPPAKDLADMIGQRLAGLGPQLERIDPGHPDARELRRLVGEEMPDLIDKYRHIPAELRRADRNGRVPEQELVEGLQLVDTRIAEITHNLGADDMDRLSSHKRYLELRYKDDQPG
jgi:hypothetical protein